jgi:hypothetical protein
MDGQSRGTREETPEARARRVIDAALANAGWLVQDRAEVNLHAGPGIAVRETPTATGPADYLLFLDGRACGVLEAKPEGTTLSGVVRQGDDYTRAAPARYPAWANPLPFVYVSTGTETLFQDARDPQARPRRVFALHRPETLRAMLAAGSSLRARLATLPPLDPTRLRPCQAEAIAGVEASLAQGKLRALVSMATGAGKTYTACALTGAAFAALGVSWSAVGSAYLAGYELEFRPASVAVWQGYGGALGATAASIPTAEPTAFRTRAVARSGAVSGWREAAIPGAVTAHAAVGITGGVRLSGGLPADAVRLQVLEASSASLAAAVKLATEPTALPWDRTGLTAGQTRWYWLRAVSAEGNVSALAGPVTATAL